MQEKIKRLSKAFKEKLGLKNFDPVFDETQSKKIADNPYLQSRAMWNDMYGSLQTKLENSYRIIFILSMVIAVALVGFVITASETKIKPLPFVLHGNDIITLNETHTQDFAAIKPKLALMLAQSFIRHARSVSRDPIVNANNHIAALSVVTGSATSVLNDFFKKEDANTLSQKITKNIEITSVLRASPTTFDVRWQEETRSSKTGELQESNAYIAQLSFSFEKPSQNPIILSHNPLGFEVTQLSWSRDQV